MQVQIQPKLADNFKSTKIMQVQKKFLLILNLSPQSHIGKEIQIIYHNIIGADAVELYRIRAAENFRTLCYAAHNPLSLFMCWYKKA